VELVSVDDAYTNLKPGDQGTVTKRDENGTIHVNWDDGSQLALLDGIDEWRIITDERNLGGV
jgi:hypothetical protein